jgi:hypothetical protein
MSDPQPRAWLAAFERDAVTIAFPDWEHDEGDIITVRADFEPGWSSHTPGEGFSIDVAVCRGDESERRPARVFAAGDAVGFFYALTRRGSGA